MNQQSVLTHGYGMARNTDPAPSHVAAVKPKGSIRTRTLQAIIEKSKLGPVAGYTGNELADLLDVKLNSITPRFAELVKADQIVAAKIVRNGETVWRAHPTVLAALIKEEQQ